MVNNGLILGNRYEVVSRVGRGGMADVYKALDKKLNRYVAIKVLKKEFSEDTRFVSRFKIEAQSAAGLAHPNIVNVYDVAEEGDVNYIVMELVEGITLKEYIEKRGKLSSKEAVSISIQVAMGIEAAHKNHIVHRDIKPQNIMISKEGKVKVTDFGIARAMSSQTVSSAQMGSVHYTSPEQARGGFSDSKSDIYSLGVTMYEMVTGRVPFDGDSTVTVAIKHLQEEVVSPSEYANNIPFSLEQIILKCIQKSPTNRYLNMGDLIQDLKMSLVNPNGDFVKLNTNTGDETVIFTPAEQAKIKEIDYQEEPYEDEEDEEDDELEGFEDEYDEQEANPKLQKLTKILMVVAAILVGVLIVFVVGKAAGIFTFGGSSITDENEVKVPNVIGMDYDEAKKALNKVGLGIKEGERESSTKYEVDLIISQDPKDGKKVKKNTTVTVDISSGKKDTSIAIPDVVGDKQDDAQKSLEDAGFKVDTKFESNDTVEAGLVIRQSPDSSKKGYKGDTVTIVISQGSGELEVPSIVGMSQDYAEIVLNQSGLALGTISQDYSSEYAAGMVISQSPSAGSKTSAKAKVNVVVSKGDLPQSQQVWMCTDSITIPNYQGGAVTITLTQNGKSTVLTSGAAVNNPYQINIQGEAGVSYGIVSFVERTQAGDVNLGSVSVTFTRVK